MVGSRPRKAAAPDAPTTAAGADSDDGSDGNAEERTTASETNGSDDSNEGDDGREAPSASDLDENTAVVSVGGETFRFALSDSGDCDADFFGTFRAFLRRVDSNGEFMQLQEGIFQGMTISLSSEMDGGPESGLLALTTDPEWAADPSTFDGTSLDAYSIDGGAASGTATFGNAAGETAEGTFAVRCEG